MAFHIVQVGFFKPVLEGVEDAGANLNRLLSMSGLNKYQLDDREHYVPVNSMYAFFTELSRQEGIGDSLEHFGDQIKLASLVQWGEMVASTPDVLSAARFAEKYDQVLMSNERIQLQINGDRSAIVDRFVDKPSSGREQAEFINVAVIINGLRLAGGDHWSPLEIHLQCKQVPNFDRLLPSGSETKIILDQPATMIVFPTAMLAMSMLGNCTSSASDFGVPSMPATIAAKIERLLDAMEGKVQPNMKLIAEVADMSPRTLQRKLAEEDASLSGVIDQWRFKKSIQLLEDPGMKIKDIGEQLGYANVPNFERAFRRWAHTSPNRYRELL